MKPLMFYAHTGIWRQRPTIPERHGPERRKNHISPSLRPDAEVPEHETDRIECAARIPLSLYLRFPGRRRTFSPT